MTDIEVALTNIGEIATRDIAREEHPQGLKEKQNFLKVFKNEHLINLTSFVI